MKINSSIYNNKNFRKYIFILIIGVLGLVQLVALRAQSSNLHIEAEQTTAISNGVAMINGQNPLEVSGGAHLEFGVNPNCNGTTVTTQSDITAIISQSKAGDVLCFQEGTYPQISFIPKTNMQIIGVGKVIFDGQDTTTHAIYSQSNDTPDNVTIKGIEFTRYRSPFLCQDLGAPKCIDQRLRGGVIKPQVGWDTTLPLPRRAVASRSSVNWIVEKNYIHGNNGGGLSAGEGMIIRNNVINNNGHLAIHGQFLNSVTIENNKFDSNTSNPAVPVSWEGGTVKIGTSSNIVMRGNEVSNSNGPSLWCDVDCVDALIENNTISNTKSSNGHGIFYEISRNAIIRNNTVSSISNESACNFGGSVGILVYNSRDVEVYGNTVTNTSNIIILRQGDRLNSEDYYRQVVNATDTDWIWRLERVTIRNNIFNNPSGSCVGQGGRMGVFRDSTTRQHPNLLGVDNRSNIWQNNNYASQETFNRYGWYDDNRVLSWQQWQTIGNN